MLALLSRCELLEINENGTKTMKTGGTKTLYSWHDGGIVSITESAKTTADNLKNPLIVTKS
jgi:hypothetical protein